LEVYIYNYVYCIYWICIPTFYLTFFLGYGILAGILCICSDILSGRYADILGIYSDIVSILSGIYSNIPSDSTEIWRPQFRPPTEIWTWRWSSSVLQLAVEDLEEEKEKEKEDGMHL
jgi:hypothetical protein